MTTATEREPGRSNYTITNVSVFGILLLLSAVGGLIAIKTAAALTTIGKVEVSGTLRAKSRWIDSEQLPLAFRALADTANYFSWVMVALLFGVIIGALVRAFVPASWLERTMAKEGLRGQLISALVGAPLMLCSCCAAPVFEGLYERTRRLGPALGLMLASPALNPAVLVVTFMLFPGPAAWARLAAALLLVLLAGPLLGRIYRDPRPPTACAIDGEAPSVSRAARELGASLKVVAWRSLPAIVVGVLVSALVGGLIPVDLARSLDRGGMSGALVVIVAALVALPLALPTFGEIPLALGLLAGGAPEGAAVAVLIAGPTVNAPSLLALARATSWPAAAAAGAMVLATSICGGLAVDWLR